MTELRVEKTVAAHRRRESEEVSAEGERVTDGDGDVHELAEVLGKGGEGAVFATEGGDLAVKMLATAGDREALRRRLQQVRRYPLEDLPIARPLALLESPHLGYVMSWLTDVVPMGELSDAPEDGAKVPDWYRETGGLRRRLRLLGRLAGVFARLHGRGLVFGDPSPNNVFVSESSDHEAVWLIDPDNLCFERTDIGPVYTPFYGAPELVRGEAGMSASTDAWGFAVLAFETLALLHPLIGDRVDADVDLEEPAMRGELPWVDHSEDDANRASFGLPRDIVLSKRLVMAFERTFGPGMSEPLERPGASTWRRALLEAADMTLRCPECDWTFYANCDNCPACDAPRPAYVLARLERWFPASDGLEEAVVSPENVGQYATISAGEAFELEKRHSLNSPDGYTDGVELEVSADAGELTVRGDRQSEWVLASAQWDREKPLSSSGTRVPLPKDRTADWSLHFGPRDEPHRVARFRVYEGGA